MQALLQLPWVPEVYLFRKRSDERAKARCRRTTLATLWLVVAASPFTVRAKKKGKKIPLAPRVYSSRLRQAKAPPSGRIVLLNLARYTWKHISSTPDRSGLNLWPFICQSDTVRYLRRVLICTVYVIVQCYMTCSLYNL